MARQPPPVPPRRPLVSFGSADREGFTPLRLQQLSLHNQRTFSSESEKLKKTSVWHARYKRHL